MEEVSVAIVLVNPLDQAMVREGYAKHVRHSPIGGKLCIVLM